MFDIEPVRTHLANIKHLPPGTVVMPSYPGSGAIMLGNIFIELGLNYFDPYNEVIDAVGRIRADPGAVLYRARLAGYFRQDREEVPERSGSTIYCKSHLRPEDFGELPLGGIVLLQRDPRDSIYSFFNWRLNFAEEKAGTFGRFLQKRGLSGLRPVDEWIEFNRVWLDARHRVRIFRITHFESLKSDPIGETLALLEALGIQRDLDDVTRAVENSSFDRMRAHEDRSCREFNVPRKDVRGLRRGLIGEWREWCRDPALSEYFQGDDLCAFAQSCGYNLKP